MNHKTVVADEEMRDEFFTRSDFLKQTKINIHDQNRGCDNQSQMRKQEFEVERKNAKENACYWQNIKAAKTNFNAFAQCDSRYGVSK